MPDVKVCTAVPDPVNDKFELATVLNVLVIAASDMKFTVPVLKPELVPTDISSTVVPGVEWFNVILLVLVEIVLVP